MARLVVLRGETVDRRIDLLRMPIRIGRGQKNDVVLDDPLKGISRDHAEIRQVGDDYVLVDLESENGIWVSGRRVPEVVLGPDVVASIGPFRLMIADDAAQPVANRAVPAAPPVAPQPVRPQQPHGRAAAKTAQPPANSQQKWVVGGIAAIVIAGAIAVTFVLFRGSESQQAVAVVAPPPDVKGPIADAERQIAANLCKEAIATIDLALQRYPNNVDLMNVRQRAETCTAAAAQPSPPLPDVAAELQAARDLIGARDCAAAMTRIDTVLATDPQNMDAQQLQKQAASACSPTGAPATALTRKDPLAVEIPPQNGGLPPQPNELDRDYQVRVKAMRDRYDEAVATAAKGPSTRLIATYEALLRDTSPQYLDVAARLADARRAWVATAKLRVKEAEDLEAKESWNDAIGKLNEARKIDPSLPVDEAVARIEQKKIVRGEDECRQGRQSTNYGRHGEAAQHYRRALELLPPSNPCYETAQRYVGSAPK
jgi:tetratricopeptide (TPR) repeat protein